MANPYYARVYNAIAGAKVRSQQLKSEFNTLVASFDAVYAAVNSLISSIALKANIASPTFTGVPAAPTAAAGTSTTQLATTAFVAGTAFASALPAQAGNAGKFVTTDGATASWGVPNAPMTRDARTANDQLVAAYFKNDTRIWRDITANSFAQTFAAASTIDANGWMILGNSGTGDVTLTPTGADTIDGLTGFVMYPGEARIVYRTSAATFHTTVLTSFYKVFTGNGNFVKPPGYKLFGGQIWGAGGSGGKQTTGTSRVTAGGGGGCTPFIIPAASFGATEVVTIAAATAGPTANGNGVQGGNSTLGALATGYGGGGGWTDGTTTTFPGSGGGVLGAGPNGAGAAVEGGAPSAGTNNDNSGFGGASGAGKQAIYGGGAGGKDATGGGASQYGGGGGGGANAAAGGSSKFGGAGGAGASATSGVDGTAPAGGGGATATGTKAGDGARGECRIWGM